MGSLGGNLRRRAGPLQPRDRGIRALPVGSRRFEDDLGQLRADGFEDRSGTLWFGTHGSGLNRFDRATGTFTRYQNDPRDPSTLSNDFVFCIHEDRAGRFWVATYGGGLNLLDRTTGTFTVFRKEHGLPDDALYGIVEDARGMLWLSTNSGLARFDPQTRAVRSYTMADGLQSNEFNGGSYYQTSRGEMFFGGINGVTAFDPARIKDDAYAPPIAFTRFEISGREVPLGPAAGSGRTALSTWSWATPRATARGPASSSPS